MDIPKSHRWSCINFLGQEGHKDRNLINKYSTNNAVRRHLTPPAVILTASDDGLVNPVTNGLEYYKAMHDAGNECTLYSYPTGNHGWGFGPWFKYHDQMLSDLGNWLKNLQTPKEDAIKVACIGNSITDGYGIDFAPANGYPAQLQKLLGNDYYVKNFGVSARTMLNKGDYPYMNEMAWKDALAFKPDIVIIKLGTNDSKPENWQYNADFKKDLQQMITTLRPDLLKPAKKGKKNKKQVVKNEGPQIFLCTPIPAFKSTWNINDSIIANNIIPIQQQVAQEYNLQVIDLHSLFGDGKGTMLNDGIHPNEKGAQKMAKIIADAIKH
jgi:lysophospholipase L1-like esterase